jgi:hypothetical protein
VKIGIELADGVRHPVVELTVRPHSRVRRTGSIVTWMPRWTEIRVLVAEYAPPTTSTLFGKPGKNSFRTNRIRSQPAQDCRPAKP